MEDALILAVVVIGGYLLYKQYSQTQTNTANQANQAQQNALYASLGNSASGLLSDVGDLV